MIKLSYMVGGFMNNLSEEEKKKVIMKMVISLVLLLGLSIFGIILLLN